MSCLSKPSYPSPAAFRYPDASLAALRGAAFLRYEGSTIGMDGGSHVYILSTPDRKKVAVWNRCVAAKMARGDDPAKNAFMLQTGDRREDEHAIGHGSELEGLLIAKLSAGCLLNETFDGQHRCEAEIIDGLRDRDKTVAL